MTQEFGYLITSAETVGSARICYPAAGIPTSYNESVGIRIDSLVISGSTPFERAHVQIGVVTDVGGGSVSFGTFLMLPASPVMHTVHLSAPVVLSPGQKIGILVSDHPVFGTVTFGIETDPEGMVGKIGGATYPAAYLPTAGVPGPVLPAWGDLL